VATVTETCAVSYEVDGQRRTCGWSPQHIGAASGLHWDPDAGFWREPILPVIVGSTTEASAGAPTASPSP
jgi:hypothetical protein